MIVFVFLDRRRNMRWSYRKSLKIIYINLCSRLINQNLVSFTCFHCIEGLDTCGGSRRYGFALFTMEVCVRSSTVFCIETIWSNVSLYRSDFTCVTNLLQFVSKRLVSKRLCIETTVNRDNNELVNQDARIVWAFLMSSLEVSRYDFLFHDCPLAGNTRRLLEILSIFYSV